jgi:formylglycine-generating enzyme required for sulfatase activity
VRFVQIVALTSLALTTGLAPAHAEKRIALVIGNDRYANLSDREQLRKAVNDARAVSGVLRQIGFDVVSGENLGRQAMIDKLDETARRLSAGDTVFFFFAGHGVAVDGANYILPADVPDVEKGQVTRLTGAAVREEDVTAALLRAGARVAVVVLDACRDNPFGAGTRGVGGERGLAPHEPPSGVFTFYSASRGQAALDRLSSDDGNPNSVFTRVLVPALTRPGLDLPALAVGVREEVARIAQTAGHPQRPAYYDETVGGQVYLAGLPQGGGKPQREPASEAAQAWAAVQNTTSLAALDEFITQFGYVPVYGALARARREELAKQAQPHALHALAAMVDTPVRRDSAAPLTAAQERGLKPKDAFRECESCPEMVVLPAGAFTMGSPESELGHHKEESPQHVVTIRNRFAAGKLHVTVDQFAAFVHETGYDASSKCVEYGYEDRSWRNPGFAQDGLHPVVCVRWNDANAYVNWLAKKTGKPYRLLSEAEWEYAARARTSPGVHPRFWFGDDEKDLCVYGNGGDQSLRDSDLCNDGYAHTSPAGHYKPNAFGLYDMSGNAWQWTEDCWHESYSGGPADGSAWTTGSCFGRVVRGGSWSNILPWGLPVAERLMSSAESHVIGFRVARTLTP